MTQYAGATSVQDGIPPVGSGFASSVLVGCDERWRKPKVVFETKSTIVEFNRAGSVAVARLRHLPSSSSSSSRGHCTVVVIVVRLYL